MLARFLILTTIITIAGLSANLDNAKAFDASTCSSIFPAGVDDVDWLKVNGVGMDFGDGWHWGGSPTDYAVICWASNGHVSIKGRLYADSPTLIRVGVHIKYYDRFGSWMGESALISFDGQNGASKLVSTGYPATDRGAVNRVRIRLVHCGTPNNTTGCEVVNEITRNRGD